MEQFESALRNCRNKSSPKSSLFISGRKNFPSCKSLEWWGALEEVMDLLDLSETPSPTYLSWGKSNFRTSNAFGVKYGAFSMKLFLFCVTKQPFLNFPDLVLSEKYIYSTSFVCFKLYYVFEWIAPTAVKSNALAELMNRASTIHWKNLSWL